MGKTSYLLGLGSNRYRHGPPRHMIAAAIASLEEAGLEIEARSTIRTTPPLGPGSRNYANAAIRVQSDLSPPELLSLAQSIEKDMGRRSSRRWGDRIIDIDLLLWSKGCWDDQSLTIPHPELAARKFVLEPLAEIAPSWRHPVLGYTLRQLFHRLQRNMLVDQKPNHP